MDDEAPKIKNKKYISSLSCTSLQECQQHHRHKGDLEVTSEICDAIGEKAQVIIVWVRAPNVENAFIMHLSIRSVRNTMTIRGHRSDVHNLWRHW